MQMLRDVFEVTDRTWRGIGMIPASGWRLSERYRDFDAEERFAVSDIHTDESALCRSGEVLQGLIKPHECSAFGKECTPRNPLGATMVSSEGACAAYYTYRRLELVESR
jgi:hydrogenase expression/formation protein HypD